MRELGIMNAFETKLCEQLGKESFDKVQRVKVGIAGLGGLGSNSAMNLVRSGFRKFLLVDFDRVETANLNRQFYFEDQMGRLKTEALEVNLKCINPVIEIETCSEKVERSNADRIFNDCDVIVEAFDKAEYKSMLVEKMLVLKMPLNRQKKHLLDSQRCYTFLICHDRIGIISSFSLIINIKSLFINVSLWCYLRVVPFRSIFIF